MRPVFMPWNMLASSIPTAIGWPVKPLVFAITSLSVLWVNVSRKARTSDCAEPPRAGVYVSWEKNTVSAAMSCRSIFQRCSISVMKLSTVSATWSTSNRVPWKAEFAVVAPSNSAIGCTPRSSASEFRSTTNAAAPIPRMRPFLRRSNGSAVSSTTLLVAAAPDAAKPPPIHSHKSSPVTSSADMMTTRSTLSAFSQSSATPKAAVAEAHARLMMVFGPRMPEYCANCE